MYATIPSTEFRQGHGYTDKPAWAPSSLEAVRDMLRAEDAERNPTDLFTSVDLMHIDFLGDVVRAMKVTRDPETNEGKFGPPMDLTRRGMRQLASKVLPGRGLDTLDALHKSGPTGRKLASLVWATLAAQSDRSRVLRLIDQAGESGGTSLVVRGAVSDSYADFTDLHLVESMLAKLGNRPVISWKRWHTGFNVRVRINDDWTQPALKEPVAIVEGWNGEVASRAPTVQGGQWTWWCLNGAFRYTPERVRKFRHVGNLDALRANVGEAVDEEALRATGVIETYTAARDIAVDDLAALMMEELLRPGHLQASEAQAERAVRMLTHDSIPTPDWSLARGADAITFAAQSEGDRFAQEAMEFAAMNLLDRGLSRARGGRIKNEARATV